MKFAATKSFWNLVRTLKKTEPLKKLSDEDIKDLAHFLSGSGWVKLEDPREFWIIDGCAFTLYEEAKKRQDKQKETGLYQEIIHVREIDQ